MKKICTINENGDSIEVSWKKDMHSHSDQNGHVKKKIISIKINNFLL